MLTRALATDEFSARRLGRDRPATVVLVIASQTIHWLTFAAIPLLLPLIRADLRINFTQAGMLSAASALSYTLCQLPAGFLADRFGPRRLFLTGMVGWSLLSVSFGLVGDYRLALLNQFIAGGFRAMLFIPGVTLLASWFPAKRRATAMSLALVGVALGSVVLSLVGPLMVERHGWRTTFVAFALLGLVTAAVFALMAKDNPNGGSPQSVTLADIANMVRFPIMWLCNALQFVRFTVTMGFAFWLPSYLATERDMSLQSVGFVMALSAALTAPANALGAYLSDRLQNPPLIIGVALLVLAIAAALVPLASTQTQVLAAIAVFSVFVGSYFGPLFLVPVEVLGTRVAGTSAGFGNLFANIGGFITVSVLGVVKDQTGSFSAGFLGISAVCGFGVVISVLLGRLRRRALSNRPG